MEGNHEDAIHPRLKGGAFWHIVVKIMEQETEIGPTSFHLEKVYENGLTFYFSKGDIYMITIASKVKKTLREYWQ